MMAERPNIYFSSSITL